MTILYPDQMHSLVFIGIMGNSEWTIVIKHGFYAPVLGRRFSWAEVRAGKLRSPFAPLVDANATAFVRQYTSFLSG
jgi:hypothetical protein